MEYCTRQYCSRSCWSMCWIADSDTIVLREIIAVGDADRCAVIRDIAALRAADWWSMTAYSGFWYEISLHIELLMDVMTACNGMLYEISQNWENTLPVLLPLTTLFPLVVGDQASSLFTLRVSHYPIVTDTFQLTFLCSTCHHFTFFHQSSPWSLKPLFTFWPYCPLTLS